MEIKNKNISILILLALFCLLTKVSSRCSYSQKCNESGNPDCIPIKVDTEPEILAKEDIACPEYAGKPVCCNSLQDDILSKSIDYIIYNLYYYFILLSLEENFKQIDNLFGKEFGGCDICSINLKRLWCYNTCSPQQSDHSK